MKPVKFYFDFISPYSYIASQLIEMDPAYQEIAFDFRPVLFGTMLSKLDAKGPGEIPSRRKIGLQDVILLSEHYGLKLEGPPTHPFNSVYALRSVCDVEDQTLRGKLMRRYFKASWAEGLDISDVAVLRDLLQEVGIDQDPEETASKRENRAMLKRYTKEALAEGAWGVPTFVVDDLVFFGQDRLPLLASYLAGKLNPRPDWVEAMLQRPQPGRIV